KRADRLLEVSPMLIVTLSAPAGYSTGTSCYVPGIFKIRLLRGTIFSNRWPTFASHGPVKKSWLARWLTRPTVPPVCLPGTRSGASADSRCQSQLPFSHLLIRRLVQALVRAYPFFPRRLAADLVPDAPDAPGGLVRVSIVMRPAIAVRSAVIASV